MTHGEEEGKDKERMVSDRVTAEGELEKEDRNRDRNLRGWIEKVMKPKGGGRKTEDRSVSACFVPLLHPSASYFT